MIFEIIRMVDLICRNNKGGGLGYDIDASHSSNQYSVSSASFADNLNL